MRVVVQRVGRARVVVDGATIGAIERGLVLLVGFGHGDGVAGCAWMARKIAGLRVFEDDAGLMNASLRDVGGAVLAVPNFTLLADCRRGRRPSFAAALAPEAAEPLFRRFVALLQNDLGPVASGRFGATMRVELENEGPVTLVIDSDPLPASNSP
ncbi:MAG TPA: D-aminoacyl-tRNA deacylase [Candidatus Binatia bacterium]